MNWFTKFLTSSLGRKMVMALTGLFLISFLVVHCSINATIFYNDGGKVFTVAAHFMATNPIIRTIEIVLVAGFIVHIIQGLLLWKQNKDARPVQYAYKQNVGTTWYSRSMALLGTLLLLFLVVHTSNFWIPNRLHQFRTGEEIDLYHKMFEKFHNPIEVLIYLTGCILLFWHLLHGFQSAFQSMGWSHPKYKGIITTSGMLFSVIVPLTMAMMPLAFYFNWIRA